MAKTASYTQKAIKNYRNKHDFLNLTVAKGTRARMSAAGLSNSDVVKILMTELERREADQGLGLPSPEDFHEMTKEEKTAIYQRFMLSKGFDLSKDLVAEAWEDMLKARREFDAIYKEL